MTQNKPLKRLITVFIFMTVLILIQNSQAIFGSYEWTGNYRDFVYNTSSKAWEWTTVSTETGFKQFVHSGGLDIVTGFFGLKSWQTFGMLVLMVWAMKWTWQKGKRTGSFTKMILNGIKWAVIIGFIGGMLTEWHAMETVSASFEVSAGKWVTGSATFYHAPWVNEWYSWAGRISSAWTSTLQFIVIPTVFFSIVALLTRFGKDKAMKSFFIKGFTYLTIGAGVASAVAFLVGIPFLGAMGNLPFGTETGSTTANDLNTILGGFFPTNIVSAFQNANNVVVPIILFALAFGGFTVKMAGWGKDYQDASNTIEKFGYAGNKIFNTLLDYVIGLLPLAIIALLSRAIIRFGNIELLKSLAGYLVYVYAALVAVYILTTLFTAVVTKTSPIKVARNGIKAVMTGFFTQSSLATSPISIKVAKEAGNSDRGSEIIPTMATTMGAWGCAGVYPTAVVMALVAAGAVELNVQLIIMTIIVTMFASIGIAGVPGVAGIAVGIVLAGIGQSQYYALFFALLYPLESLVDMGRTAINVHAGQVVTAMVETENNTMNWAVYRGNKGSIFGKLFAKFNKKTAKKSAVKTTAKVEAKGPALKKAPTSTKAAVKKAPVAKKAAAKPVAKKSAAKPAAKKATATKKPVAKKEDLTALKKRAKDLQKQKAKLSPKKK